eukprot:CAMPEP_0178952510 /NCGR_PEP_ID=MMETSP0789-20121207/7875_1 /TAXON_ID=3005 /ORGANISM="Rhizosolenia setigera, Strain CCMP 1694" /LENGTH=477 /DNA_ID=CAMNT_0020633609 /DNA_START=63 /DNA_END=1496 /DNA_ORIENTATION=+
MSFTITPSSLKLASGVTKQPTSFYHRLLFSKQFPKPTTSRRRERLSKTTVVCKGSSGDEDYVSPNEKLRFACSEEEEKSYSKNSGFQSSTNMLLGSVLSRAASTLSSVKSTDIDRDDVGEDKSDKVSDVEERIENLVKTVTDRSQETISRVSSTVPNNLDKETSSDMKISKEQKSKSFSSQYLSEPCLTNTALAHYLWEDLLYSFWEVPSTDDDEIIVVIDATCGNGNDSLKLADLMFYDNDSSDYQKVLVCMDVQSEAVQNTKTLLSDFVSSLNNCAKVPQLLDNRDSSNNNEEIEKVVDNSCDQIYVLQKSHSPLNLQPELSACFEEMEQKKLKYKLICYNLGWLPSSSSMEKTVATSVDTTLQSLSDAALLLTPQNGLLSVITYPGSNEEEARAVSLFCESMALFTSRNYQGGWKKFLENSIANDEDKVLIEMVKESVEKVYSQGDKKQTWRVFEHRPAGRPLSPVLITAMRIK